MNASKISIFVALSVMLMSLAVSDAIRVKPNPPSLNSVGDNTQQQLQDLGNRIAAANGINAKVLGDDNAWNYMYSGLSVNNTDVTKVGINYTFTLDGISFQVISGNGDYELVVSATSPKLWGHEGVPVQISFMYTSTGLIFVFAFQLNAGSLPSKLIPNNSTNVSGYYTGMQFTSPITVEISSSSFTDLNSRTFKRGLEIVANIAVTDDFPIAHQLHDLIYGSGSPASTATGVLTAYFPLSTSDPFAYLTVNFDGNINFFNSAVTAKDLQLLVTVDSDPDAKLTSTVLVALTNQTLSFSVVADANVQTGLDFNGKLDQPWVGALGLKWLTLSQWVLDFQVHPLAHQITTLTMNTDVTLSFSGQPPVNVQFDIDLTESAPLEIYLEFQTTVVGVVDLFDDVIGVTPANVDQVKLNGPVDIVISTANANGKQAGLTITATATSVGGNGDLASSVSTLTAYSKTVLNFNLYFFSPVFSQPSNVDFKLSETNPFHLSDNVVLNNVNIQFTNQQSATTTLTTQAAITFDHETTPQLFDLTSTITSKQLTFLGEMEGKWNQPFGLTWLQLSDITVNMVYDTTAQKLTTFNVNADYNITVAVSVTPKIVISFQGDFHHFTFSLDVMMTDMKSFLQGVGLTAPQFTDEISATANLVVTNLAQNNLVPGINVQGQALVYPYSTLSNALRSLNPNAQLSFDLDLAIPIWASGTFTCSFEFAQSGSVQLTNNIQLNGFDLVFDVAPTQSVSLKSQGKITLAQNQAQIVFDLSGDISTSGFSMSGKMDGSWNQPFGLTWLQLNNMNVAMQFQNYKLSLLQFSGDAQLSFASASGDSLSVTIATSDNFQDIMLQIQGVTVNSLSDVVQTVTGKTPDSTVDEMTSLNNKIDIVIATYAGQGFVQGLTIKDQVTIQGSLLSKWKLFNNGQAPSSAGLTVSLTVPLFGSSADVEFSLQTNIPITLGSHATLNYIALDVQTNPAQVEASLDITVTFANNPPLTFDVDGTYKADGSIVLGGDMIGTWENMFGITGFDISNVDLAIGFNGALCAADLCIAALGLGYNLTIGTKDIAFYGYVQVPEIEKIFLEADFTGADGMALSFQDVATEYNKLVGADLPHLNVQDFPADWGLTNLYFYLAPEAGTFNQIHYNAGFFAEGGFRLLGVDCEVEVDITSSDFQFHVNISVGNFNEMVNNEIRLQMLRSPEKFVSWSPQVQKLYMSGSNELINANNKADSIVSVTNVALREVSCNGLANQNYPQFEMDYTLFGHNNNIKFDVDIIDLWNDFDHFFHRYLANLFH